MAKAGNLIIKSPDGKLTVATGNGQVVVIDLEQKVLRSRLLDLIADRQKAGKKLTDALEHAGFHIEAKSQTHVWDPIDSSPKKPKKSKKR